MNVWASFMALMMFTVPLATILIADFIAWGMVDPLKYVEKRMEFEVLVREAKRLRSGRVRDKRVARKLKKMAPELEEARRYLVRVNMLRLAVLLPLYVLTIIFASSRHFYLLPFPLDIPFLTVTVKGTTYMPAAVLLIISYFAWMPFIQYPLILMVALKRRGPSSR